jgi:hypothetical protein
LKILLIIYDFYPENKPNAYRWFNVVKYLQKRGYDIYVVTSSKNQFLPYENIDGIKIYRSTEYFIGSIKYKYRDKVNDNSLYNNNYFYFVFFLKNSLKNVLKRIYQFTWVKFYWPDYSFLWFFSALPLASKIIEEQKIEKLITVSWTFTAHLIGFKLKSKYNSLYWLADTIDVFSFNVKTNNTFIYSRLNRLMEKKIFFKADFNTVLTNKIKQYYIEEFPGIFNKILVNNNIFVPNDFDYCKPSHISDKTIRILFLGTLSEEARSPKRLLVLIDQIVKNNFNFKIIFDFYGDLSDSIYLFYKYPHLINNFIFIHGFVSREKILHLIKSADVLLNVGNNNEFQEPSKLIEYMYSGKRILNVCSAINDTSLELLNGYPLKFNVLFNDAIDSQYVDKVIEFLVEFEECDRNFINNLLNDYFLEEVSKKYMNLLEGKS